MVYTASVHQREKREVPRLPLIRDCTWPGAVAWLNFWNTMFLEPQLNDFGHTTAGTIVSMDTVKVFGPAQWVFEGMLWDGKTLTETLNFHHATLL